MSASDADQVQDPVLAATDPVISHEVPVPVDGQILKDVSNLGSDETPESVAAGLVSLNKADASNGAVGPTTSADEKENTPSHEQSASMEDGVFVEDKEVNIHGSDIALEKTKDVQDAPNVEADNAASSDSITTDNVDDTTSNEKDNDIIAIKDIPSASEVESVTTVEHGIPADSDLIAPAASTTEENTIDDSVNDSAIEILPPVLDKNQTCAKNDEDDAGPADDVKLAETGNHNEAVQMDERDATDNVDGNPEIMNEAPNGETLATAAVALQEEINVDVDITSSVVEGDAPDIDAVPETKEGNTSIEAPESNLTDSVVSQVDTADVSVEPATTMKDNVSSDHVESAAATSEAISEVQEDVPKATVEDIVEQIQGEDAPAVAEEQASVVEAVPAYLKEDGAVDATETEIGVESNDTQVTAEEVEQGGVDETSAEATNGLDAKPLVEEVEADHDVNNTSNHEDLVHFAVEEEPKVTEVDVGVVETIPDSGEDVVVAVDETEEASETVEEPTNNISTPVEEEPVGAGTEVEAEVALEDVSAPVKGEPVPASEEITAPSDTVHEAASEPVEEVVLTAEDVETVTPETTKAEASAKIEVEPVVADEEVITAPGTAGFETNVEKHEEAPVTIEVQHVEYIAEEANEETTVSVLTEPCAETEGVTEKASETAGHDDVVQAAPGSVEPDSIPTSDDVAATVVEVAEAPVPAPVELSEESFATTVNVEDEEIPASVDALDETTVVEAESAPIEAPVEFSVATSLEAEHDVAGEAAPVFVAVALQTDDGTTHAETPVLVETESVTAPTTNEAAPIDADNDTVVEAQVTHTEIPGEIPLDTELSTAVVGGEAIAKEISAPAVEAAGVEDVPETAEASATLETGSKDPLHIIGVENAGTNQGESVSQADEATSVEETPSAKVLEPEEEESALVAEVIATAGQGDDEESTIAPVVESVAVKELRTDVISIETSLDTTPFTPILDSGIAFKEQEPALSTLSSISEEFERPKSSWAPSSFQISTVGGVESSGVGDAVSENTELAETGEPVSVPLLVVEDTPVNEQVPTIGASEDFVSVDQPPLGQPPLSWTPSYSVHSQGSPTRAELAEDISSTDPTREIQEPAAAAHEFPLVEQDGSTSILVEEGFTAEVINHESSEQIVGDAISTFGEEADQVSEPAPADLTEVSEAVTGGLVVPVGGEDANKNADQEANQEGSPLVATKELEDVPPASVTSDAALLAERSVENHPENAVTVDSEHDNTVGDQINATEGEVHGPPSTEVSHANPVIALEGHKIENEPLNPQQSNQAETKPLVAAFDEGETPSSVEQSQNNNIGEVVAAAIAPAIAMAALGARIQGLVPVAVEEVPQVDATLTVDTTAAPLLSVPSEVDATDIIVDALERPRSPWTPSYSVTEQGVGLSREEEAEVDHLEPLSLTAAHATATDSEPLLNEVQENEPDSNALQTRPSYTVAGPEEIAKNEQFFLFGLRAIVAYLWVLPKWLSMTPSDHSRRGSSSSSSSSSSSKFFPGGWFTPKPNEGRTSLDVAQGEFASSSKVTTSNDVFETLGSEVTDSSAAVNVAEEDYGRKRKWCVVM